MPHVEAAADHEIVIVRVYDAPVQAVWAAWVEPEQVAKWWGPRGFTLTTEKKDVRAGGVWSYTMHGPDGTDYPNLTTFHDVVEQSLLVYDHGASATTPPLFRVTARFAEAEGQTTLELRMALPSAEAAAKTRTFIKAAGGDATWDRLAEHLAERRGQEAFYISRSFAAPIDTVFAAWTDPDTFSRWLAPKGFSMTFLRADLRAGGSTAYSMSNGAFTMYGRAFYDAVDAPHRLEYRQEFCDERGELSRHPMAPTWPATMRSLVTFAAEGPAQTRVTVRWNVHGEATAEEHATFVAGRAGMTLGWTGSFDKLDNLLALRAARVSAPHVAKSPAGPVAFVHCQIAKDEIRHAMGPGITEVFGAIKAAGRAPTGPWFTLHHRITPERWDFDICVPVDAEVAPSGRVQSKTLEPLDIVEATYTGPYEGLAAAWPALRGWLAAQDLASKDAIYERYDIGPESALPPHEWKTTLMQTVELQRA